MKVFISWSGERSKLLAMALREWLPPILQAVNVWMSEADIDAGDRWGQEVSRELSECSFGIICVTPENLSAPWLMFEAGALAKTLEGSRVIPLLFELELRDIALPLSQFQAKKFDKQGLSEVVGSINKNLSPPVAEVMINTLLDAMWPRLHDKLEAVPKREAGVKRARSQTDILEELVAGVRGFDSRLKETEMALSEQGMRVRRRRPRFFMPMMFDMLPEFENGDPLGLLVISGLLREDFPWISEVLLELYRDLRKFRVVERPSASERAIERIRRLIRSFMSGPFMDDMGVSRDQHMMLMELPNFLERYLRQLDMKRMSAGERIGDKSSRDQNPK